MVSLCVHAGDWITELRKADMTTIPDKVVSLCLDSISSTLSECHKVESKPKRISIDKPDWAEQQWALGKVYMYK